MRSVHYVRNIAHHLFITQLTFWLLLLIKCTSSLARFISAHQVATVYGGNKRCTVLSILSTTNQFKTGYNLIYLPCIKITDTANTSVEDFEIRTHSTIHEYYLQATVSLPQSM